MKDIIAESLDKFILETDEERAPDGKWHPSSMFQCARMNVLSIRGVIPTSSPDAQAKRIFKIGKLYHALVQDALPRHPKIVADYPEFRIEVKEWNVVGAGDALIELDDGDWYVVEIKSTKSLKYTPKEDHVKQASVYFTAARDFGVYVEQSLTGDERYEDEPLNFIPPLGNKLKGIILVYLNKNDLEIKQYYYPYDPKWRKGIEARVEELDKYRLVQVEELPPVLPLDKGKPNWYLRYCNYRGSGFCCADVGWEPQEDDEW